MCYRENRQVIWFSYLENAILASIKKESRKTVQAGACTVFCFMVKFSHKCAENRIFHTNHAGRIKRMILPEAFLERMEKMLGEEYPDFLKAYEEDKYQALRLNALKYNMDGISAAQLKKQREDWLAELKAVPWAENGYYYPADMQPGQASVSCGRGLLYSGAQCHGTRRAYWC